MPSAIAFHNWRPTRVLDLKPGDVWFHKPSGGVCLTIKLFHGSIRHVILDSGHETTPEESSIVKVKPRSTT